MHRLSPACRRSAKLIFTKTIVAKEHLRLATKEAEKQLREFVYEALFLLQTNKPLSAMSAALPSSLKWLTRETFLRIIQRCFSKGSWSAATVKRKRAPSRAVPYSNGFVLTGLTMADLKNSSRDNRRRRFAEVCGLTHPWLQEYCSRVLSNMPKDRLELILNSCKLGPDVSLGMLIMCVPHSKAILNKWCGHLIPASDNITELHKAAHAGWCDGTGRRLVETYIASVGQAMLQAHEDRQTRFGNILLGASTRQYIYEMMAKHHASAFAGMSAPNAEEFGFDTDSLFLADFNLDASKRGKKAADLICVAKRRSTRAASTAASIKITKALLAEDWAARNEDDNRLVIVVRRKSPCPVPPAWTDVKAPEAKYVSQLSGYTLRIDVARVLDAYYNADHTARCNWCSWAEARWIASEGESPLLPPGERLLAHCLATSSSPEAASPPLFAAASPPLFAAADDAAPSANADEVASANADEVASANADEVASAWNSAIFQTDLLLGDYPETDDTLFEGCDWASLFDTASAT